MSLAKGLVPKQTGAVQLRSEIEELEESLHALPEGDKIPPDDVTQHFFAEGVYARMIFVPAGHVIVGKIHKHETMNILCQGKISVATEQGTMYFEGPCIVNSAPGIKKAAYAVEDTWWINIHPTTETDLAKIEDEVIVKDYEQIEYIPEG